MNRRGVALIIAISLLAALLFLALPFLFSQSASVAGSRAAAWDGSARRGSDRALGLAAGLTVYATGLHRSPSLAAQLGTGQLAYVQLPQQIGDELGSIRYPSFADNSWRTLLATSDVWTATGLPGLDGTATVHGAIIEDESRRIDPNCLDMYGWAVVLKRAGIEDPWTVYWRWDLSNPNKGFWTMTTYGRLARAMTYWRPGNGSRRYNRLEDLLGADPEQPENWYGVTSKLGCVHFGPLWNYPSRGQSGWPPGNPGQANTEGQAVEATREAAEVDSTVKVNGSLVTMPEHLGWRVAPLTQAELERLRPLLSFLVPGQGRSGLIDLGTVVASESRSGDWWGVVTDELAPPDTGVVGGYVRIDRTWTRSRSASSRNLDNGWAAAGDPLAIDAIPALNINTVPSSSGMTRLYQAQLYQASPAESDSTFEARIQTKGWAEDPIDKPTTSLGRMPLLRWLDPRTGDGVTTFERPPLGIAGFGIVAVEGLATARDQQGNAVAQRRRRVVMQAVPQERPIEAAWTSQGDFEALVRLRHGSWMVAGPHPTNRIQNWGEDASGTRIAQDMQALDGAGWLEPAPLCSFGLNPAVSIDWRLPFGLTKAQTWDNILAPVDNSKTPNAALKPTTGDEPAQLGSSGTTVGALTAQGLNLKSPDVLGYDVSTNTGPLRFSAQDEEMSARHMALRFCLPTVIAGDTVTLLEVRNQIDGADSDAPDTPTDLPAAPVSGFGIPNSSTESQNVWRVEYRDSSKELVLVIANAALPWRTGDRTRFGVDGWNMPADTDPEKISDDRSAAGGSLPFAPPDPASRVEFRYKVPGGLRAEQWYHLQVFCASDRPGLHGLVLDGIVGRDLTRDTTTAYKQGDHYTYPSMRLVGNLTQAPTLVQTSGGAALSGPTTIDLAFPAELKVADLLPSRGLIRIDDEYLAYTGSSDSGSGRGQLTGVQRARRVRSNQAAPPLPAVPPATGTIPNTAIAYPLLQQHVDGAQVSPGWARVDNVSGHWLHGYGMLKQDFLHDPQTGSGTLPAGTFPATGTTITVVPTPPATASWPQRGVLRITYTRAPPAGGGGTVNVAFNRSGGPGSNLLELDWDDANSDPVLDQQPTFTDIDAFDATLISLWLDDGVVTNVDVNGDGTADHMWGDAAQLMDTSTGACEWVRITGVCDRGAGKRFLINTSGWDMTSYVTPQPNVQPRGMMRTPWRVGAWPGTTTSILVLPVQTQQGRAARLESGDELTAVVNTVVGATDGKRREPIQVVVRHAARDGFPLDINDTGAAYNVDETWFALTHRVPDDLRDEPQTWLIGRGWSGDDLSTDSNSPSRRGSLPRKALLAQASGPARLFIGSADRRTATSQDVIIDDVCAGAMTAISDGNVSGGGGVIAIAGSNVGGFSAADSELPITVLASVGIFQPVNGRANYGLVQIDGEVFAYRRGSTANEGVLIARGLLGTAKAEHRLAVATGAVLTAVDGGTRTVQPMLPAIALPMGPVAELCGPLPQGGYAAGTANAGFDVIEIPYGDFYKDPLVFDTPQQDSYANDPHLITRPPFVLIHDPTDNTKTEVTRLLSRPASTQRLTASWLRGLYGTSDLSWTSIPYTPGTRVASWTPADPGAQPVTPQGSGALNPIIIGWWPRFAPGLTGSPGAEALRCRSFAWAGFALRLSGSRFDPDMVPALTQANGGVADIQVATDAGCSLTATALAAEQGSGEVFDWDNAWPERSVLSTGTNDKLVRPFQWPRFQLREVDGAELRVHWSATGSGSTPLERAADAAGRAPRLENIHLRCVAPARVLAVEEVR
jgi:hypothetical protein